MALAGDYDKKTVVTLNEPVIVAGVKTVTLEPGRYVFRLMNSSSNRNIVEIFNEREDHLYTIALAIPNYQLEPKDKTVFRFWETPQGNPVALKAWFFPGDKWGQEFIYPKGLAAQIARDTGKTVLAQPPAETEAELTQATITEITKSGEEQPFEYDQYTLEEIAGANAAPEAEPQLLAQALAPQAREIAAPAESLPATASPYFLLGALGILFAVVGLGLKRWNHMPGAVR